MVCLSPIKTSLMCTAPELLCSLDPKLPYTIVTNASGTAAGGVLMQDQGDRVQPLTHSSVGGSNVQNKDAVCMSGSWL